MSYRLFKIKKNPHFILAILFLSSILLRINAFDNSLEGNHGWLTAHTQITLEIWNKNSWPKHNFNPIYTYTNNTNNNEMRSLASGIRNHEGQYYYVSYPPFSFIFSFLFFKILFIQPSIWGLQVLNLLLHGITAYLLYCIICILFNRKRSELFFPAILASIIYLFSVQSLWCHVFMYFADSLIQPIWTLYILIAFLIFQRGKYTSNLFVTTLGFINFLAVYTEWLGLFMSLVVCILATKKAIKHHRYRIILIVLITTSLLALGLTIYQYSLIDGLSSIKDASISKYSDRSGYHNESLYFSKIHLLILLKHYWRLHLPSLLFIAFLTINFIVVLSKSTNHSNKDTIFLLSLIALPVLLHHLVFLEFSMMHDFSTLKSLIFFSVLIALLFNKAEIKFKYINQTNFFYILSSIILLVILALNISLYYEKTAHSGVRHFESVSHSIRNLASEKDALYATAQNDRNNGLMVFMGTDRAFSPQIQLLTKRNILAVKDMKEAIHHMDSFERKTAKVFKFNSNGTLTGIDSIKLEY